jgi:hypothetical protein
MGTDFALKVVHCIMLVTRWLGCGDTSIHGPLDKEEGLRMHPVFPLPRKAQLQRVRLARLLCVRLECDPSIKL